MSQGNQFEIFISYRRDGGVDYARMIFLELKGRGYNCFFDFNSLRSGKFNEDIFKAIDSCRYFILVLSENALKRCMNEDDWVRHEIEYALSKGKEIIPVSPSGCTRGFPDEMPTSFEPLRNIQVSRLEMEDLFEKSFDKIVEDRFDAQFREGRSPQGAGMGVQNSTFKKIGVCIAAVIALAAGVVSFAILRSSPTPTSQSDSGRAKIVQDIGEIMSSVNEMAAIATSNGISPSDPEIAHVRALQQDGVMAFRSNDKSGAKKKFLEAQSVLRDVIHNLVGRKLGALDETIEASGLDGDAALEKRYNLVEDILRIRWDDERTLAERKRIGDLLFPKMNVVVRCDGKEVPATLALDTGVIQYDNGPCIACAARRLKWSPTCVDCRRAHIEERTWLTIHPGQDWEVHKPDKLLPAGTPIKTPKMFSFSKNGKIGPIMASYVMGGKKYTGRTAEIVANWVGMTNVVIDLSEVSASAGEVRKVCFSGGDFMEFVWCPPGSFSFEYKKTESSTPKQETITVKSGFWIARRKITESFARRLRLSNNHGEKPAELPVYHACNVASCVDRMIGGGFRVRLPTAAEWELAASYERGESKGVPRLELQDFREHGEEWTVGMIDEKLGLEWQNEIVCRRCKAVMSVRGGGADVSSDPASPLTRRYMKGRELKWMRETPLLDAGVRLVAEDLPSQEQLNAFVERRPDPGE